MTSTTQTSTEISTNNTHGIDLTAAPRAVLRESVRLLYQVLGEERLGSASGNAWAAVCADRQRAKDRAEVFRLLAAARTGRGTRPTDRGARIKSRRSQAR
jgi:hypothetical protein